MKKTLALVLAFVMVAGLATVAMASPIGYKPVLGTDMYTYDSSKDTLTKVTSAAPGDTLYIPVFAENGTDLIKREKKDELKDHKVSLSVQEGNKVFDSASIVSLDVADSQIGSNGAGTYYFVKVVTKSNYSLEQQDLKFDLTLAASKPSAKSSDKQSYAIGLSYTTKEASSLFGIGEGNVVIDFSNTDDEWVETEIFFGDDDVTFASKMYKQPDLFIGYSSDPIEKYEELYGDKAALDYHWFTQP